ncbi:MAG: glycosyltransferase family 2 protein [Phycisphaerales bacterium]
MLGRLLGLGRRGDERTPKCHTVSVVTPSFNQAEFLPRCLASVRSQRLRAMEHLVFDPGSSDGSREIAAQAEGVTLIAEPDEGQADAVGRGMRRARGDVIAWLNSDDAYADGGVFRRVVDRFNAPDAPDIVYGRGIYIDAHDRKTRDAYINSDPASLKDRLAHEVGVLQPATFIRRTVVDRIGVPDINLQFAMDYEFWIRAALAGLTWAFLDEELAWARYYEDNKTLGRRGDSYAEIAEVAARHYGFLDERWARRWAEFNTAGHDGILKHSANAETDTDAVDRETARILGAFNWSYRAKQKLAAGTTPAARHTRSRMEHLGLGIAQICKPVPAETPTGQGLVCYTVGEQRWAFESGWLNRQLEHSAAIIERLRANRRGDLAVVVGNGPSLNDTDLSLLDGVDTFVSNYAPLKPELLARATFLSVVNHLVAEQGYAQFNLLRGVTKIFPYWLAYCIAPGEETVFLRSVGYPEFSTDLLANVSWRHTVSFFHLQLAYGLGYRRVALIGFDHSYSQRSDAREGEVIEQHENDQNHFDPRYFRGKNWHAADVDNMEAMYRLAKEAYEADGRSIVNATVGGRLELFERADLASVVRGTPAVG